MTNIVFYKSAGNYIGIEVEGHTGYATAGKDILCSAISGIIQTGALGIVKVLKINARYASDEERGLFKLDLPKRISEEKQSKANVIFDTMKAGLEDLESGYSKFMKLEVENVY